MKTEEEEMRIVSVRTSAPPKREAAADTVDAKTALQRAIQILRRAAICTRNAEKMAIQCAKAFRSDVRTLEEDIGTLSCRLGKLRE